MGVKSYSVVEGKRQWSKREHVSIHGQHKIKEGWYSIPLVYLSHFQSTKPLCRKLAY